MNIIKLVFNSQFCGYCETIVKLKDLNQYSIDKAFEDWIGMKPDENCSWVKVK